ncbi:CooT family nickel-binding protein [Thermosulfurimonas marina]|uniref:CooT family nickel-binding protein n=1 Tax=Thermosulfurimonas marina TaxID=2047767 RepID=A0A6H1WTY6_9BACT|nr:CooT family nickel-binding protein [Thermosulfurimonas marina]QJA06662.1 CooT family nickel-binding protein [Thermosulfurimonas marina]
MCQARVVVKRGDQEEELMRDVVALEMQGEEILLKAFFEEPRRVKGRLREIDFLKHTVVLEEA